MCPLFTPQNYVMSEQDLGEFLKNGFETKEQLRKSHLKKSINDMVGYSFVYIKYKVLSESDLKKLFNDAHSLVEDINNWESYINTLD